jgi:hypothetical protein
MTTRESESTAATAEPVAPDLVADLERLRELLARSDVEGARAWVKDLEQRWPQNERVRHYAQVLAPPTVRAVPKTLGRSLDLERAWLREHAREYPGCWIAVLEDRLIAADPDLGIVLAAARQSPDPRHTLIHFQMTSCRL